MGCGSGCGGRGVLIGNGAKKGSLHHNLFVSNNQRHPEIQSGALDFVNNVIHNFGGISTYVYPKTSWAVTANIVNNYYQQGPNTTSHAEIRLNGGVAFSSASSVFVTGNKVVTVDGWLQDARIQRDSGGITELGARHHYPIVATSSAVDALTDVLNGAGATVPVRDSIDARIVNEVDHGTGQFIADPAEVGGYPLYKSGTAPPDTDRDGMPDSWETHEGFDPSDPADGSQDANGNGYTNVEEYLNSLTPRSGEAGHQ